MQSKKMKTLLKYLLIVAIACCSCSTYRKIPNPEEFPVSVKGMLCKVEHLNKKVAEGEIIVVDSGMIYVLSYPEMEYNTENIQTELPVITAVSRSDLDLIYVYVASTTNNPSSVITWALLMPLLSFTHGWWAAISLPVNVIFSGSIIASATGIYYGFTYPGEISWEGMKKFARFPQGWPENVSPGDVK